MKDESIHILKSFNVKSDLNPDVWVGDKIKPEIRHKLLKIADDFIEDLDIEWVDIEDVVLTGSLANFNWSKYSDFDVHILLNFDKVNEDVDMVKKYFDAQKNLWNNTHDITIDCYEVELYVEDVNEEHTSTGIFSLENNSWLIKPSQTATKVSKPMILNKAKGYIHQIKEIFDDYQEGEYEKVLDGNEKILKKLKQLRKSGLNRGGEYSYENLAYKLIRRLELLDKLRNITINSYDFLQSDGNQCTK